MTDSETDTHYRLKLREGDVIQATVTQIGGEYIHIDVSEWSNIDEGIIVETGPQASNTPGTDLIAEVSAIDGDRAKLNQKRGTYRRNHLPGDSLRMQAIEQVSASVCRATLDQFRNIDTLYLVGAPLAADVTATLAKLRNGTAYALPDTVHDEGLKRGRRVQVQTTAGSTSATITNESGLPALDHHPQKKLYLELAGQALATGPASAEITGTDADSPQGTLVAYPTELPQPGDQVTTRLQSGESYTKVRLDDSPLKCTVQLSDDPPVDGKVIIDILGRADGYYEGEISEYADPPIEAGETYDGRVYASRNRAKLSFGNRDLYVTIRNTISSTGTASIKIVEISDEIYGRLVSDIESIPPEDDTQGPDVDITDVSRF